MGNLGFKESDVLIQQPLLLKSIGMRREDVQIIYNALSKLKLSGKSSFAHFLGDNAPHSQFVEQ
jgi:hypothetical protein